MSKKKEVKFRHNVIVKVSKLLLKPEIKRNYGYKFKTYKELKNEGPFIVLGNHTVPIDPILMGMSFPFHLYYFATEQIFNLGFLSKLLIYAVNPIRKAKSISDMSSIRKAKQIVNEGASVAIYPEGNVTYDGQSATINKSIVKLIRFLRIPVIFFITKGLYFSNPRWSIHNKKGKSSSEITEILKPEVYDLMEDDELYHYINERLYTNAYEQNIEKMLFKGKNIALGLERLAFMDLKTNEPFVTYSQGSFLKSKTSNFHLEYLETGYVKDLDGNQMDLIHLNKETIKAYRKYYLKTDSFEFVEHMFLEKTTNNRKKKIGKHSIKLRKDGIEIHTTDTVYNYSFSELVSLSIQGKKKIIIYTEKDTWLVTLDDHSSPYKYLLTYQFYNEGEKLEDADISKFGL